MENINELKIFLVDDDLFYLNLMSQILSKQSITDITKFDSGFKCLDKLDEKPDVIFLDYSMDTLDGYEVLKKIKRYDPNIYVVMVSAQEDIEIAVESLKHGAFDYIQKGNDSEEKVKKVLKKIVKVKKILEQSKPTLIKKIFKFL